MDFSQRKRKILKIIIDDYISTAEPVSSKTIAGRAELGLSPATIRNEMADLESMGYLEQPHTSAGRIPSPTGYRMYVNELMGSRALSSEEMSKINGLLLRKMQRLDKIVAEAGRLAAEITSYTAYSTLSAAPLIRIYRIEAFAVEARTFIVVMVTDADAAKNKVVHRHEPIDTQALGKLVMALNANLSGLSLGQITGAVAARVERGACEGRIYLEDVMEFIFEELGDFEQSSVYLTGASHILNHPEYRDMVKARRLLEYLYDGKELSKLPAPGSGEEIRITIGPENFAEQLRDASVVAASYNIGENMKGIIGVVGPTRMNYSDVASRLAYFINKLNRQLNDGQEE